MSEKIISINKATPILTRLKEIYSQNIYSFHALPIASVGKSDVVGDQYLKMKDFFESSITEELFDSFFFSKGVISESQELTAKLYQADASFYITCGTSTANHIAITALYEKGDSILIDRNCHQSIHFHTQAIGADINYIYPDLYVEDGEISAWSYDHIENTLLSLQERGKVCDIVVLTAQSYEGLIYDIPNVLKKLLDAGVKTRKFLIDEAWGSLNYFCEDTKHLTAMNVDLLLEKYPDVDIICTHSAHKSLFCLRQASIIHCKGTETLPEKIEISKYRIHTTSPSYPILASLDAAQEMMFKHGEELAIHSRKLVDNFISGIISIDGLDQNSIQRKFFSSSWHIHYDPTKILLDISSFGTASEIKQDLCNKNIYLKRFINNKLLFNFHIGINQQAVSSLLSSLKNISTERYEKNTLKPQISEKFIIPYPPGVPLVFPGEIIDAKVKEKIDRYQKNGFLIIAA